MDEGLTIPLLIFVLVLTALWWFFMQRPPNFPPGPYAWPIVGWLNFLHKNEPYELFMREAKKYGRGDIMGTRLGSCNVVVLNGVEIIKEAFVKNGEVFNSRPETLINYHFKKGKGIVHAPITEMWTEQRRFTSKTLRNFGMGKRTLEGRILTEISFMFEEIDKFDEEASDAFPLLNVAIANIICSILFGDRFDYKNEKFYELLKVINSIFKRGRNNLANFMPVLKYIPFVYRKHYAVLAADFKRFVDFFKPIIAKHREEYQENDERDFIDAFLVESDKSQNPNFRDDQQLCLTAFDLFTAGSESTATTVYWFMLYMVVYPDVQEKIQEELDRVVGENRFPSLSHQTELVFTRASIREIQRLVPIAPFAVRHYSTEDAKLKGYFIPKGTVLLANLWAVLHDSEAWEEPYSFNPNRFIDTNGKLIKPEEFIPFCVGRRACIGEQLAEMELFLVCVALLHTYKLKLPEGAPKPSLKGKYGLNFQPHPFQVIFERKK